MGPVDHEVSIATETVGDLVLKKGKKKKDTSVISVTMTDKTWLVMEQAFGRFYAGSQSALSDGSSFYFCCSL